MTTSAFSVARRSMRASPASAVPTASRIEPGRRAGQEPEPAELHAEHGHLDLAEEVHGLENRAVAASATTSTGSPISVGATP